MVDKTNSTIDYPVEEGEFVSSASEVNMIVETKKGKGCMKWGCLGTGCLMIFIFIVGLITTGLWFAGIIQDWSCNFVKPGSGAYNMLNCTVINPDGSVRSTSNTTDENSTKGEIKLEADEYNVVDIVEKTEKAVVSIAISTEQFDYNTGQGKITSDDIGTGFLVDDEGLIVTNQHVVSDPNSEYVVYVDGEEKPYKAEKILRDSSNDIALVKIDMKNANYLKMGDSDGLKVGQSVIAIGNPLGKRGTVTTGIISGLNRSVSVGSGDNFFYRGSSQSFEGVIQTDAAINPGNSGGPLIDMNGHVIAINFATTSGFDNISFALPINRVKTRVEEYEQKGYFSKPYLGVAYESISAMEAQFYKNIVAGALVNSVVDDSPASKAGIQKFDIITEIDGKDASESLISIIQQYKVGDEVTLKIYREGEYKEVKVKLEETKVE